MRKQKKICQKDFTIFLCSESKSFVKAVYFANIYPVTHLVSFDSLEHFGHGTLVRKQTDNYPFITALKRFWQDCYFILKKFHIHYITLIRVLFCLTFGPRGPGAPGGPCKKTQKDLYMPFKFFFKKKSGNQKDTK